MARPKFIPNVEHRKMVRSMAAYGIPQQEIARCVGSVPCAIVPVIRRSRQLEHTGMATGGTLAIEAGAKRDE
jgi:hypothetical protein